jgi:hypothetical protein
VNVIQCDVGVLHKAVEGLARGGVEQSRDWPGCQHSVEELHDERDPHHLDGHAVSLHLQVVLCEGLGRSQQDLALHLQRSRGVVDEVAATAHLRLVLP